MKRCNNMLKVPFKNEYRKMSDVDKYEPIITRWECLLYCPIVFTRKFVGVLFTDIKNKYVTKKVDL